LNFLFKAFGGFPGALTEFGDGFAKAAPKLGQSVGSEDQERHQDDDHDMDRLDSEWHSSLLFG